MRAAGPFAGAGGADAGFWQAGVGMIPAGDSDTAGAMTHPPEWRA